MEKRTLTIIMMVPFLLFWHWFEPTAKKNQAGIKAYEQEKYDEALKQFMSARGIKPDLETLKSNTAATLYQMKNYEKAIEEFSKIDPEETNIPKGYFHYNLGNSFFRLNKFDKALAHYKESLLADPGDIQAKKNFEITLKKIQQQKQKNQDQEKNQDQQKKQQEQKQDKQKKHQNLLQYLNQQEKKEMKKKKRAVAVVRNEKDW